MRCHRLVLIVCISLLLLLASCGGECKKAEDCKGKPANAFTPTCTDKKCSYAPVPDQCGNEQCEQGENRCTCPLDCKPPCVGKVVNSQYLVQQCIQNTCIEDIEGGKAKPIASSAEQSQSGDKFKFDTLYSQPFNLKKDTFNVILTLSQQGPLNRDHHILNAEITGTTKDGRTITLTRQDTDKYVWTVGSTVSEELILDFITTDLEGELSNLALKINYEYAVVQAGKKTVRQGTLQNRYKEKFIFVKPSAEQPCPASCDDKNAGTRDTCGPQTRFFCKHESIPGTCGNYKCDGAENKCTCAQDCGICSGSAGNFLDYTCKMNQCSTQLKAGANIQPNALFDDRSLGPVQLHNNYKYNNPLDVSKDKFELDFKVYKKDPTVTTVTIETIRLLESGQQIAEQEVNQEIKEEPTAVTITLPSISEPEEDHTLTLAVWYKYVQDGKDKTGKFEKSLGKVTLIKPG